MHLKVVSARLTVLAFLSLVCSCKERDKESQPAPPPPDNSLFGKIHEGMEDYKAEQLLGSKGEYIQPIAWPTTLGECRGYEKGITYKVDVPNGPEWTLSPKTKVGWRLWRVSDEHKWIALGFINDGTGGAFTPDRVIVKRSGLKDSLPLKKN